MAIVEDQMKALKAEIAGIQISVAGLKSEMARGTEDFTDKGNLAFAGHQLKLEQVVMEAARKFSEVEQRLSKLHGEAEGAVVELRTRVTVLEEKGRPEGKGNGHRGYLPHKNTVPKTFGEKVEEWRQWREDVMDFFDEVNPGMKEFLEAVTAQEETVDELWIETQTSLYGKRVTADMVRVWRALKRMTAGETRKVITAVKVEDGFVAWQRLHQRYEPGLATCEGIVLAEFSAMVAKPARSPQETKMLITEMDRKMKAVDEVGVEVSESHAKSVLIGLLDPETCKHTAMSHGKKTSYEGLKKVVLEFANNTAGMDPMQIGRIDDAGLGQEGGFGVAEWPGGEWWQNGEQEEYAMALKGGGKGVKCYNCQGNGHLARNCPIKGKGKGKKGDQGGGWREGKGAYNYQGTYEPMAH